MSLAALRVVCDPEVPKPEAEAAPILLRSEVEGCAVQQQTTSFTEKLTTKEVPLWNAVPS